MWARCLDALKRGARPAPAAAVVAGPTPRQEDAQNLCEARPWELALRPAVLTVLGGASRLWMHVLNDTKVEGSEILAAAVQSRAPGRGLLTVSNHVCALDDPLVVAAAMPASSLLNCTELRWTLCATDRCFKGGMADSFFRAAKVLPVQRGAGLLQPGLLAAERRLAHGDWVHMVRRSLVRATAPWLPWPGQRLSTPHALSQFPEGTRSQDGHLGQIKRGVGRLFCEAAALAKAQPGGAIPLVVPIVHSGMDEVNPRGKLLRTGKTVRVLVGEPLDLAPLLCGALTQPAHPCESI